MKNPLSASVYLLAFFVLISGVVCVVTEQGSQPTGLPVPSGNLRQQTSAALKRLRKSQAEKPASHQNPDDVDWAPPGETIVVTPSQWADFETSLGIGTNEPGPVWLLLKAVIRFLKLAVSLESTALLLQNALSERGEPDAVGVWDQYLGTFADVIEPLDNHLWDPDDPTANSQTAKNFVDDVVARIAPERQGMVTQMLVKSQSTPGLMNRGGTLDPGKIPEPTVLGMKVMLRRLFDYNADPNGGNQIFLNSGPFLQVWELAYSIVTELSDFELRVGAMADPIRLRFLPQDAGDGEIWRTVTDSYPVGLYRRENIGYDGYFNSKYEGTTRAMGTDEELSERWGMETSDLDISNMVASYRNQLDGLIKGLLPAIMDALADIAVKAYDMGEKSRLRSRNWPLLNIPGLDTSIELLKKYPEWSEGRYTTAQNYLPQHPDWMDRRMRFAGVGN
ncbi:hypothetical protein TWF730_002971 [Orbilia blumenaviensis]|uniref:DUF1592 domain-containing protein n=1 Tax=Orbilia blumenaviensis TaxID=1796055 RepID=A0AAV9U8C1_9PEZI